MNKLNYITTIKFLSGYMKNYRHNFLMFYVGWLMDMVISIVTPILFGLLIDEIVYYQNVGTFLNISGILVLIVLFSCILYFFIYAQHQYLTSKFIYDIKKDVFQHIHQCRAEYLSDLSSGDLMTTLQACTSECLHFMIRNVIHFTNGILKLMVISTYLFLIDWKIGLFLMIAAPFNVYVSTKFGQRSRKYGEEQRNNVGQYSGWLLEVLSHIREMRILGAQEKVYETFEMHHRRMFGIDIKSSIVSLTSGNIIGFINLGIQLGIYVFCGYLALTGKATIGTLMIIISLLAILTEQIGWTSSSHIDAQNRIASIQRLFDFLHSPDERDWPGEKELVITQGEVVFDHVSFSYPKRSNVLQDLNLHIPAADRKALVGESGSGKTTLAYMLLGFYRPERGRILIDGQDIAECSLSSLRRQVGLIAQDVLVFDGTIRENIVLGNPQANDKDIEEACRLAGIWKEISGFTDGLQTVIGTNGVNLSGGQKQRIAIARIYLRKPKIIIFDEATSALDKETEYEIHEAWKNVLANRTSLIIAHRPSAVALCDSAAVLKDGSIYEEGTYEALSAHSMEFRKLFAEGKEESDDVQKREIPV